MPRERVTVSYDTFLERFRHCAGAGVDFQLLINPAEITIDRMNTEREAFGNFLFNETADHELEDFLFAFAEAIVALLRGKLGKHLQNPAGDPRCHG